MFRRVLFDHWQVVLAAVLFLLTLAGYVFHVIRALRMNRTTADRLARLPLEESGPDDARMPGATERT